MENDNILSAIDDSESKIIKMPQLQLDVDIDKLLVESTNKLLNDPGLYMDDNLMKFLQESRTKVVEKSKLHIKVGIRIPMSDARNILNTKAHGMCLSQEVIDDRNAD